MDCKLTTMDIAQALVRRSNIPAAEATAFVRQFFDTIHDGLLLEKIVKVRGFGTFKLVSVDSRESVSVVDGSRIQIASHTKVTFTPDAVLRDAVNKPFAEFETVILSDDLNLDDLEAIDTSSSPSEPSAPSSTTVSPTSFPSEPSAPSSPVASPSSSPSTSGMGAAHNCADSLFLSSSEETQKTSESSGEAPVSEPSPSDTITSDTPASDSAVDEALSSDSPSSNTPSNVAPSGAPLSSAPVPHHGFWQCFFGFLLGLLLFVAGYCVGYLRPFALPLSESAPSVASSQPSSPSAKQPFPPSAKQPSSPSAKQPLAPSTEQPSSPSSSKESVSGGFPAGAPSPSGSKAPSETLAYPQLEDGEYWIVGIKGTEIMKPGRTLLNFSLKYYKSKDFVPYICTMNDIKNPDVVPLNKELKIPELRKK